MVCADITDKYSYYPLCHTLLSKYDLHIEKEYSKTVLFSSIFTESAHLFWTGHIKIETMEEISAN